MTMPIRCSSVTIVLARIESLGATMPLMRADRLLFRCCYVVVVVDGFVVVVAAAAVAVWLELRVRPHILSSIPCSLAGWLSTPANR